MTDATKSKYKTKQQRLIAIVDAYQHVTGVKEFTTDEVALWALVKGLWEPPKRGCSEAAAEEWERKLEAAIHAEA